MTDIFNLDYICVNERISSQQEAFVKIAQVAADQNLATDRQSVVDGLSRREQEGSTGFMDGFAIPHTKCAAVQKPGVVILTSTQGIEWQSMDGKPARFIISLLIPDSEAGTTHLTLLSHISRLLIHNDIRQNLLNAGTPAEILAELNRAMVSQ